MNVLLQGLFFVSCRGVDIENDSIAWEVRVLGLRV